MKELTINTNQKLTLDSREVAELVGKRHDHLMRDIERYSQYISKSNNPKVGAVENFFLKSTYVDAKGQTRPNYRITKKGCEFIAHKLTGEKGALFTAAYINRFHEMEQSIKTGNKSISDIKQKEIEARLRNAKVRQANTLLKIASNPDIPSTYRQVLQSYAAWITTGKQILPLPEVKQKSYTAEEIGQTLNISANMVGRIANKLNLKTSEFGEYVWDKAKHVDKQVATFRYYVDAIEKIREYLNLQSDK